MPLIPFAEVAKHNTPGDCWTVINGKVYDLTSFAPDHPGGAALVTDQGGKDCTKPFLDAHPETIMELTLGAAGLAAAFKGEVDTKTIPADAVSGATDHSGGVVPADDDDEIPPAEAMLNLHDFEACAQWKLCTTGKKQAWDYYSSGADDEYTYQNNTASWQRMWLKPRILVNVASVDTRTTILGTECPMPVFYSAVAMCGMGHPDGEVAWVRSARRAGIIFMAPNLSSRSWDDITAAAAPGQTLWFQMYVNPDREIAQKWCQRLEASGVRTLCITVDSAVAGKRERDLRNKIQQQLGQLKQQAAAAQGTTARKAGNYANRDPALNWEDVRWFQQHFRGNIVIKGAQCAEDVVRAAQAGCQGVLLSNHGGRNLDTARSAIEILPEAMQALRDRGLEKKIEVYVDGGVRRGTDIIKAVALGARAVGLGKPAVFSMSSHGEDGMVKMLDILRKELVQSMQLCGAPSLAHITADMVDTSQLTNHAVPVMKPVSPYKWAPKPNVLGYAPKVASPKAPGAGAAAGPTPDTAVVEAAARAQVMATYPARSVLSGVFARGNAARLHRSAVLLSVYAALHALRNLLVLGGRDVFNRYCHFLHRSPLKRLLEYYLLAGAGVHAVAASVNTWNKRRMILKKPWADGKLLWSGIGMVAFVVAHLRALRFGPAPIIKGPGGEPMRDMWALSLRVFRDPATVAWHLLAVYALFLHYNVGWPKAARKVPKDDPAAAHGAELGAAGLRLGPPAAAAFAAAPLYLFLAQHPATARLFPAP